jgi:hypothetical protein
MLSSFLSALLVVAICCPIAWLILSRWLERRAAIIASVASARAVALGRFSYAGPASGEALNALAGIGGALLAAALIARIWLSRSARQGGKFDG